MEFISADRIVGTYSKNVASHDTKRISIYYGKRDRILSL